MKLIPAGGSPRMQKALVHRYVRTIVAILLHDLNLLYAVAPILIKYDRREPRGTIPFP